MTYIWSSSLCQNTQLKESEMRPTGCTLSYTMNSVLLQVYVAMLLVTLLAAGITYAKMLVVEAMQVCLCFNLKFN